MNGLRRWLPLVGAASIVAIGCAAWPFTIDDAFILGRYARRIATGEGYTMIAGPPTDGVTGPLALVPGLIGQLGWGDPVLASKLAGLVAAALAVALVVARAARESVARGSMALLVAVSGATLGIWSVAGLETGLATLALTVAALAVGGWRVGQEGGEDGREDRSEDVHEDGGVRGVEDGSRDEDGHGNEHGAAGARGGLREARGSAAAGVVAGIAIAALAWLRPELAVASGVLLVSLWREDRRAGWVALGLALAGALAVVAFRVALFGSPLPLSAQAKPPDLANGASYVARGALVALGGGGLFVAFLAAREGRRMERVLVAALGAHLVALLLAGGDWMPGFRLLAPVIPSYALAVSGPIASRLRARRGRALALLAACVLIPSIDLALELPRARDAGRARETAGRALATELEAHAQRVAMVDAGYLAYRSRVEVIDLGGVTDPSIGALPGAHLDKRIDPGVLRARSPDTIVLHSSVPPRVDERGRLRWLAAYPVEERVARMPWVVAEMRVARVVRYSPEYFYVVLRRPADDAP